MSTPGDDEPFPELVTTDWIEVRLRRRRGLARLQVWAGVARGQVMVTFNGVLIGQLVVRGGVITGVEVRSDFRRQGIATAMHAALGEHLSFRHANTRTRAGNAWSKTLPNYKKAGRLIEKLTEPQLS